MQAKPTQRAGVFLDESWWVLWPRPANTWAEQGRPIRVAKAKAWSRGERPPSTCLYATMDVGNRTVASAWHPTWNQEETWAFLQGVIARYATQGMRFLVVFWDNGPWHVAKGVRAQVATYNRQAKQDGGLRVLLFFLPTRSPWLMPLEAVFGQAKRAVGLRQRGTLGELQDDVERRLAWRNARVSTVRKQAHV